MLLPLVLQVPETFFTLVTLNICDPAALPVVEPVLALEPADGLVELAALPEPDAVPLISTSLLTCELSFEVSPWS